MKTQLIRIWSMQRKQGARADFVEVNEVLERRSKIGHLTFHLRKLKIRRPN